MTGIARHAIVKHSPYAHLRNGTEHSSARKLPVASLAILRKWTPPTRTRDGHWSTPLDAETKPTVIPLRKKPRPAERAAQARANKSYSMLEKLAARGEGPFCFRVGNLVRYPVDALEVWRLANDARQPAPLDDVS